MAEGIILDTWGNLTNWSPPQQRVESVSIIPQANGVDVALDVRLKINENLTSAMTRRGFIMACRDSVLLLFENPQLEKITEVRVFGSLGSDSPVARLAISKKLASQIPWSMVMMDDVVSLINSGGGDVWLIPALR